MYFLVKCEYPYDFFGFLKFMLSKIGPPVKVFGKHCVRYLIYLCILYMISSDS